MEGPLVSVITVTYNSSKYIRDAIEGVLAQSYTRLEYIIGDDNSRDGTWEIVNEYKDPRIRAYHNEKNLGEYANRAKAIDMAKGEYLIFIDGDDVIYEYGIEIYLRMALKFPEAGAVITKGYTNNVIYPYLMQSKDLLMNHFFGSDLLQSSFVSNFFRTDIVKKISIPDNYIQGDQYIRLSVAAEHPVLFIAGYLTWHRETPGQASSKIAGLAGMQESRRMSRKMLDELSFFDDDLKGYSAYVMDAFFLKICIRSLLRLRIAYTFKYLKMSGISIREVIKGFFRYRKRRFTLPTLLDYSSGNPAKYKKSIS